ncbi:MAG TPA: hypothetical protein VNV25_22370 [Gemmatimonadaceae bacterium]|nr:hypothetical protein [Gemmatimonadaceae bacterium]
MLGQHTGAFDYDLQFSHVPWPIVFHKRIEAALREARRRESLERTHEPLRQQRNIFTVLTKGWHVYDEPRQSCE